jgi:hypothetical protein
MWPLVRLEDSTPCITNDATVNVERVYRRISLAGLLGVTLTGALASVAAVDRRIGRSRLAVTLALARPLGYRVGKCEKSRRGQSGYIRWRRDLYRSRSYSGVTDDPDDIIDPGVAAPAFDLRAVGAADDRHVQALDHRRLDLVTQTTHHSPLTTETGQGQTKPGIDVVVVVRDRTIASISDGLALTVTAWRRT